MDFVEDLDSSMNASMMKSDKYAADGFLYDAFIVMNRALAFRFSRMGFMKAIFYLFQMVDECLVRSKVCLKNASIVNECYKDINRMTRLIRNRSYMHFWAGCIKVCQFRTETHRSVASRLENLLKARQHLRCAIDSRPNHILATYLYTMCDSAYQDRSGTQSYYCGDLKLPDDFYVQCVKQESNFLLPFSFILAKLGLYLEENCHCDHYVGIAMSVKPQTDFEKKISSQADALMTIMIKARKPLPEKYKPPPLKYKLLIFEEDEPLLEENKPIFEDDKPLHKKNS